MSLRATEYGYGRWPLGNNKRGASRLGFLTGPVRTSFSFPSAQPFDGNC